MVKQVMTVLMLLFFSTGGWAGGGKGLPLEQANNDLWDQASLQRGAVAFANYCLACHSLKYMRYNRIARDIGWSEEEVIAKMAKGLSKPTDAVHALGDLDAIAKVLGTVPPDLSLMARLKGTDYIYSFMLGYFEKDAKKGVWDNRYLPGTAMPNVLEDQYLFASEAQRQQTARDLANFLEYVGEPVKLTRYELGWKVLLFLFVFFVIAYLLKREYWRDVK